MRTKISEVIVSHGAAYFVVCNTESARAIRFNFIEAAQHPSAQYIACFDKFGDMIKEYKIVSDDEVDDYF